MNLTIVLVTVLLACLYQGGVQAESRLGTVASQPMTRQAWIIAIKAAIRNQVETFNNKDLAGTEASITQDAHWMLSGQPIRIGLAAVMEGYKAQLEMGFWYTPAEMEFTALRLHTDSAAVAEYSASVKSPAGVLVYKGVAVFVIEGDEVKVSMNIRKQRKNP